MAKVRTMAEPDDASPQEDEPTRRCVVTGERGGKAGLIRFVRAPDGAVVPDLAERLPGRGLWVAADPAILAEAARKGRFARAARQPVAVDPGLVARVTSLLQARCVELLGLARRAGLVTSGRNQVEPLLAKGGAALLLQAQDGSVAEMDRVAAKAPAVPCHRLLAGSVLGQALGRGTATVHVALAPGRLTATLETTLRRYAPFAAFEDDKEQG